MSSFTLSQVATSLSTPRHSLPFTCHLSYIVSLPQRAPSQSTAIALHISPPRPIVYPLSLRSRSVRIGKPPSCVLNSFLLHSVSFAASDHLIPRRGACAAVIPLLDRFSSFSSNSLRSVLLCFAYPFLYILLVFYFISPCYSRSPLLTAYVMYMTLWAPYILFPYLSHTHSTLVGAFSILGSTYILYLSW